MIKELWDNPWFYALFFWTIGILGGAPIWYGILKWYQYWLF